jgi:hypothetical protein
MDPVVIARRFNGPPDSGHGGYSCGLLASHVDAPIASVSLRRPPPLETPLKIRPDGPDGAVSLVDPTGETIAEGEPGHIDLEPPAPPSVERAAEASARSPVREPGKHPFPTCFGCGVEREGGSAIAVVPGPVDGEDPKLLAGRWIPAEEFAGADGAVSELFVWSALDCSTGWPSILPSFAPQVLARMTANPAIAPVVPGEPHVVIGWIIDRDGRKARGGSAIFGPGGGLCAMAEGLWIRLHADHA